MVPEVIYIETTNKCNANCIMCPHDKMKRPISSMKQDTFERIVDGISKYDVSLNQIFLHKEGEPLCDEMIVDRIGYVHEKVKNVKEIGINTNAMLLTEEKSDALIESGLNLIFFSVDGTSADTYEKIRINCKYDIVEKNIKYFLEKRNKSNKDIRIVMQMLLTDFNKHEQEEFIRKWEKYNVEFYLKEMHCYLDGGNSSFEKPNFDKQISCCQDPFRILVYYVDGKVGCCCWDYDNEYIVGNSHQKDMIELFNGKEICLLRAKQKELDCRDIIPCNRCGRIYGTDKSNYRSFRRENRQNY